MLASLDPADTGFRGGLLREVLDSPAVRDWDRLTAAEELAALGRTEGLAEFVRSVIAGPEENGSVLKRAGEFWYELEGGPPPRTSVAAVAARARTRSWAKATLAWVLLLFGRVEEALPWVAYTLDNSISDEEIGDIVQGWLDQQGERAADGLVELLRDYQVWNSDERPGIALSLARAGFRRQAAELTRLSLDNPDPDLGSRLNLEMMTLVDALGPASAEEIQDLLDRHRATPASWASGPAGPGSGRGRGGGALPGAPSAASSGQRSQRVHVRRPYALPLRARRSLCRGARRAAQPSLRRPRAPGGPASAPRRTRRSAVAVRALGQDLLADPGLVDRELVAVAEAWLTVEGRAAAAGIVERIRRAVPLTSGQCGVLADALAERGLEAAAVTLWCQVAAAPEAGTETRWRAVRNALAAGGTDSVEQALRTALRTAPPRRRICCCVGCWPGSSRRPLPSADPSEPAWERQGRFGLLRNGPRVTTPSSRDDRI